MSCAGRGAHAEVQRGDVRATALADVSRQVEASASEGVLEDGASLVDGLASELERVTGELQRIGPELEP